jgi:hypothetical protein
MAKVIIRKIIFTLSVLLIHFTSICQPIVEFDSKKVDFGTVVEGTICHHRFHYKNVGNQPFILSDVLVTCGCTNPQFSKAPLSPGDTSSFSIDFNTKNKMGQVIKGINLMTNCPEQMIAFLIYANVIPDSLFVPLVDTITYKPLILIDYKSYSHIIIPLTGLKKMGFNGSISEAERLVKLIIQTQDKTLYSNVWFASDVEKVVVGVLELNFKQEVAELLKKELMNKKRYKYWWLKLTEQ